MLPLGSQSLQSVVLTGVICLVLVTGGRSQDVSPRRGHHADNSFPNGYAQEAFAGNNDYYSIDRLAGYGTPGASGEGYTAFVQPTSHALLAAVMDVGYGDRPPECPPCFNCHLPAFACTHFANCSEYDGKCLCPPGFGGDNCSQPLCGALSDGNARSPRQGNHCECPEGWEGINCNVCTMDSVCDPLVPTGQNGTCYRGGLTRIQNYQMCDVTNQKILDTLGGPKPQVTFSCKTRDATCDFQFWVDEVESFYCHLDTCEFAQEIQYERNLTQYRCENIKCKCMPDAFLCGKDGSIDLSDFFDELIRGPASYNCDGGKCVFSEPQMDDLISNIFADPSIFLDCSGGECLHYTMVPGFVRPEKPTDWPMIIASIAGVLVFLFFAGLMVWYIAKNDKGSGGVIRLSDDEAGKLMANHVPATLLFEGVNYYVGEKQKQVLNNVQGCVRPGQVLAIMGASGAGKTSLLDILARRYKKGTVTGNVYVNGHTVGNAEFKRVVGYVDQEDHMIPTLTVYETILYSALLRLPRSMSVEAKKFRVLETMNELGILAIKDSRIGATGARSISGGEKRRVSIACELVTSPSILFLDEPTSGLDAYNAYNVVECLVTLARNYNRTVVFTIHQPRSNIVALFDQLLLLADGYNVYSGEARHAQSYFEGIGHACPQGFNIADYLIDLTMHAVKPHELESSDASEDERYPGSYEQGSSGAPSANPPTDTEGVSVHELASPRLRRGQSIGEMQDHQLYTPHRRRSSVPQASNDPNMPNLPADVEYTSEQWASELRTRQKRSRRERSEQVRRNIQEDGEASAPAGPVDVAVNVDVGRDYDSAPGEMSEHLKMLVNSYQDSLVSLSIREDIDKALTRASQEMETNGNGLFSNTLFQNKAKIISTHERPTWFTQFRILSDRTFKNLYRNPMLMLMHYCIAIVLALFCGALFYNVPNTIPGFQNRMGVFFFIEALFGFSCLTSLQVFAQERILFVRERANGYYAPVTYFLSKVLFDIIPLRVIPPLMQGIIIYHMIGLVDGQAEFWKFLLVLVLFNLTAAAVCLFIGVICKDLSIANLIAVLVMLFSMLFGGLLLNKESVPTYLGWLKDLSFFNYALEALLVNELRNLQLVDKRAGLEIDMPGATILWTFGFNVRNFWPDVIKLAGMFGVFLAISFIWLQLFVKERR